MVSTGCSGSKYFYTMLPRSSTFIISKANAVRYGTAKSEWFLNVVSPTYEWNSLNRVGLTGVPGDCGLALRRSHQDSSSCSEIIRGLWYNKVVHWRRRYPGYHYRRSAPLLVGLRHTGLDLKFQCSHYPTGSCSPYHCRCRTFPERPQGNWGCYRNNEPGRWHS